MERWKCLTPFGFPDYSVSDQGRVRNDRTNRILRQSVNQSGTWKVGLVRKPADPPVTLVVARLVAKMFIEDPKADTFDTPINLDGDRSNNRADNLAWRPRWFAIQYHQQFKKPPRHFRTPIVLLDTDELFDNPRDAAVQYGLLEKDIIHDIHNHKGVWPHMFDFRIYRE